MSFSTFAFGEDELVDEETRKGSAQPLHLSRNSSQEDDTQNSSLSSLSAADALREVAAPLFQPKTLDWRSPGDTDMKLDRKNSADCEGDESRLGAAILIQSKLFAHEDNLIISPKTGQALKTRLNFNHMISPSKQIIFDKDSAKEEPHIDLSRPYEQRKTRSFPSTASSSTPLGNISGFEDADSGTTPSQLGIINITDHENPLSPEQVKFHFHVDASQCSPIPGIPEEACDGDTAMDMDIEEPALDPRSPRPIPERPPRSGPRKRLQRLLGGQAGTKKHESDERELSRLSFSNESGDGGSSTSSKMRKRPMPDMSAFDAGVSTRSASCSRNDRSIDESLGAMESRAVPLSPQLVCPPTPERTPVWAQSEHGPHPKYTWQNSLISTKVLATCPAQVLDGHSSLENSLMDDADDSEEFLFGQRPSLSYPALHEDLEGDDSKDSPIRDLSELQEMFSMPRSAAYQPRLTRTTSVPLAKFVSPPLLVATTSCVPRVPGFDNVPDKGRVAKTPLLPKGSVAKTTASPPTQESGSFGGVGSVISFSADFENLGKLGSGAFADVYKVRSKVDQQLYAVKRNRRHFRGKRDRDMAMAEVRIMQRLQSVCAERGMSFPNDKKEITKNSYSLYLLFFFRAWQEEGHFFCQTELCCRDTCREMKLALGSEWPASQKKYPSLLRYFPAREDGHLIPGNTVWKICRDVATGLSHIHSHGIVHNDIKPSNIFLVPHNRLGAMLKIGDFGMAGDVGTSEDGQEGDTSYMAPELLSSGARHPSADIFSLGLTLYELASTCSLELPSEGSKWQELRNGSHSPDLPRSRCPELSQLIKTMINPDPQRRPSADDILERLETVKEAGNRCDGFLRDYIKAIEEYDRIEEERLAMERLEADERYVLWMQELRMFVILNVFSRVVELSIIPEERPHATRAEEQLLGNSAFEARP
jgi:serine/threonine protein kinase